MSVLQSPHNTTSASRSQTTTFALVGNPGTGKSTLLNGIVGRSVFKSALSFGTGLTTVLQQHVENGVSFYDTPGLNDVETHKAAGIHLDTLLKINKALKLIFVVTVLNGRVTPEDATTISLVLDAITSCDTNDKFAVVLNQCSPSFLKEMTTNPLTESKVRSQITGKRHTSHWCYIPRDPDLIDKADGMLHAPQLSELLATMPETRPVDATVKEIDTASYEEKLETEVRVFEEKEEALRKEIEEQKKELDETSDKMNRMAKDFNFEREQMRRSQKVAERAMDGLKERVQQQQEEARQAQNREMEVQNDLSRLPHAAHRVHVEARNALNELREELQRVKNELEQQQEQQEKQEGQEGHLIGYGQKAPSSGTPLIPDRLERRVASPARDTIRIGEGITRTETILSKTGRFKFSYTGNGDLVVLDHFKPEPWQKIWAAGTENMDSGILLLDEDGIMKLMDVNGQKVWSPDSKGNTATHGVMQNDGNFVLYSSEGPVWSSNSWQQGWSDYVLISRT